VELVEKADDSMRYDARAVDITRECTMLSNTWQPRVARFKDWLKLLQLVDDLYKRGMESHVTNNPRTLYNMAVQFLLPSKPIHRIPTAGVEHALTPAARSLEQSISRHWKQLDTLNMVTGRGSSWMRELIGRTLLTGWVAVFHEETADRIRAKVWHPAQTFPEFDTSSDDINAGLARCAHIYSVSAREATGKARSYGFDREYGAAQMVYDYYENTGSSIQNALVIGTDLIKPVTDEPLSAIPIITFPVGGIPDRGIIDINPNWRGEVGQSIFATNEPAYRALNKLATFTMQMVRSAAQAPWFERTEGARNIITPQMLETYGSIVHMGLQEDAGPISPASAPVELRSMSLDIQGEVQRGGMPWASYGNIQQQMSASLFGQITSSAGQVLGPFHEAIMATVQLIDNMWLDKARAKLDVDLPEGMEFSISYKLNLPENLAQLATIAQMLNRETTAFKPVEDILDEIFQAEDPLLTMAKIDGERALRHPMVQATNLIIGVRKHAAALSLSGDQFAADYYDKLAGQIQKKIDETGLQSQPQQTTEGLPTSMLNSLGVAL